MTREFSGPGRPLRVLYVGNLRPGRNSRSMLHGLQSLPDLEVRSVDSGRFQPKSRLSAEYWRYRRTRQINSGAAAGLDADLRAVLDGWSPDILFCFKTVDLPQDRLQSIRAPRSVHYSPDDVSNADCTTPEYLEAERQWDLLVTTKGHNVEELLARGARNVLHVWSAYDPALHLGAPVTSARKYLTSFYGAHRPDRSWLVDTLRQTAPDRAVVAGERWRRNNLGATKNVDIVRPVYAEAFLPFCQSAESGIVLLNSANRDTHTCRSFEVPAAGQAAVLEDTEEHRTLLTEQEAFFFKGQDGLAETLLTVRGDATRRARVAAAGNRRISLGSHTYADRAAEILAAI